MFKCVFGENSENRDSPDRMSCGETLANLFESGTLISIAGVIDESDY